MTIFLDRGEGTGIEEVSGAPWDDERKRPVLVDVKPSPFVACALDRVPPRYSHRERRGLARHSRKWPVRVPKYRPFVPLEVQYTRYNAHTIALVVNGVRRDHWLYLPDGQRPTDAQLREVGQQLKRAVARQLHETWLETMRRECHHEGGGAGE